MAEFESSKYLKAFDPEKPMGERFNYEAFLSDVGNIANQTRKVGGPTSVAMPKFPMPTQTWGGGKYNTPYGQHNISDLFAQRWGISASAPKDDMAAAMAARQGSIDRAQAAIGTYASQRKAMEQTAEKAASGLEVKGAATAESMQRLGVIGEQAEARRGAASELWAGAVGKAGEYVQATYARTKEVVGQLEGIFNSISEGRDFAKAHAAQAGVQAVLGSMESEGRAISEQYGQDSKEYQQFTERKQKGLATLNSNITTSFQSLSEAAGNNYLNATAGALEKMNMYSGFQEQQHVETMKAMAKSTEMYDLQTSQFLVGVEQLRMASMDDMANWIVQTPSYMMDALPVVNLLAELTTSYLPA